MVVMTPRLLAVHSLGNEVDVTRHTLWWLWGGGGSCCGVGRAVTFVRHLCDDGRRSVHFFEVFSSEKARAC